MGLNASTAAEGSSEVAETPPPKKARKRKPKKIKTPTVRADNKFEVTRFLVAPTRTRGYVVRAFPTETQAQRFNQLLGQGRYWWNWLLGTQEASYADGEGVSLLNKAGAVILNRAITDKLIEARKGAARVLTHPGDPSQWGDHWLADGPRTLITQKLDDLNKSWKRFFEGKGGHPKFKRRSKQDSIRFQVDPRQHDREMGVLFPSQADRVRDDNGELAPFPAHFCHGRDPADTWVKIPNVGRIRVELSEPIYGKITTLTLRRRPAGRRKLSRAATSWAGYEIVLTANDVPVERDHPRNWERRVDWEKDSIENQGPGLLGKGLGERDPAGVVALDLSVPESAITSRGDQLGRRDTDPYTAQAHAKYLKRTRRDQRRVSRKARHRQKEAGFGLKPTDAGYRGGSRQPVRVPKRNTWTVEQKTAMRPSRREQVLQDRLAGGRATAKRQKTHDANVFTTDLVLNCHTIVVEGLTLKAMARGLSRGFRRGFNEAAMGQLLTMLAYKCDLYGRTLVVADRWFPSSKRCHGCHRVNHDLKLSDRQWDCAGCGRRHERDPNAAVNLWQEGCSAVGIPLNSQLTPDGFQAPLAGESPVVGRRGLQHWVGSTGQPMLPQPPAAVEASRNTRADLGPGIIPTTEGAHDVRLWRDWGERL